MASQVLYQNTTSSQQRQQQGKKGSLDLILRMKTNHQSRPSTASTKQLIPDKDKRNLSPSPSSASDSFIDPSSKRFHENESNMPPSSARKSRTSSTSLSFIQQCIRPTCYSRTPSEPSPLESRYGRFQPGNIGQGTYAIVRLIVSSKRSHRHRYHQRDLYYPSHQEHGHIQHDIERTTGNGKGSTTISKTARPLQHCQFYAVKIFKKQRRRENHGKYMKRLISEYCISTSMDHPNIVRALDLVTDSSGRYCIVMEYCSGGDLYQAIKRDQLNCSKINSYFKQLLLGLDYLHSLGVAHRDIKPENLLLADNRRILKITDFGVADVFCETWQRHSRLSDGFCGSLAFIAPEIFSLVVHHRDNVGSSSSPSYSLSSSASSSTSRRSSKTPSSSLSFSSAQSSSSTSSSSVISYGPKRRGYQATKVDVWSAAIVYCCMWFKGTLFNSAESSDPHFRAYLKAYRTRSFATFSTLDADVRSLIYHMLNPDPNGRWSIPQILSLPFMMNVE